MALSPAEFRKQLLVSTDRGPQPLAKVLECDPWQAADFAALDPGWQRVAGISADGGSNRAYLERPRGHSKTTDLAVMVIWALAFCPRQVSGIWAAGDRDQASLGLKALGVLIRLNPWLGDRLDVQNHRVVNTKTGSSLTVISSDASTSYGHLVDFIVIDELTHWSDKAGEDLWHSLFSAAAKKSNCMLVTISNAGLGRGTSWQWGVREKARTREDWYFSRLDGPKASWMSRSILDEQRDLLPEKVFRRLFYNDWSDDTGDLLRSSDIEAACTLPGPAMGRGRGHHLVTCGVDIGIVRDSSAVTVVAGNFETQRVALLNTTSWSPRDHGGEIPIELVENHIRVMQQTYVIDRIIFDTWQFEGTAQKLANEGFNLTRWKNAPSSQHMMANTLLKLFYERRIDLYPDHLMLQDLRTLSIVERNGKLRIEAPRNESGHCDRALAMATTLPFALDASYLPDQYDQFDSVCLEPTTFFGHTFT
jgi:hypothetical protein